MCHPSDQTLTGCPLCRESHPFRRFKNPNGNLDMVADNRKRFLATFYLISNFNPIKIGVRQFSDKSIYLTQFLKTVHQHMCFMLIDLYCIVENITVNYEELCINFAGNYDLR